MRNFSNEELARWVEIQGQGLPTIVPEIAKLCEAMKEAAKRLRSIDDVDSIRASINDAVNEGFGKAEAQRLLTEACRVLAAIANTQANGNSDPDVMAVALDDATENACAFFRVNGLSAEKYARAANAPHCPHCGSSAISADATAIWDTDVNAWTLADTCDTATCEACGAEIHTSDLWGDHA